MFIVIDGVDGAGKTTQVFMLKEFLIHLGRDVVTYRDPGGTPGGEAIRTLVKGVEVPLHRDTVLLLFSAARCELAQQIKRDLESGRDVIVDRWISSTLAYQGEGQGCDPSSIATIASLFSCGLSPLTIVLDLPAETAWGRVHRDRQTQSDRFESQGIMFMNRVRRSFARQVAASGVGGNMIFVDALDNPEQVHCCVRNLVMSRLLGKDKQSSLEYAHGVSTG